MLCLILVFHVRDTSSRLDLGIYALFQMVLGCLRVVVEFFEVVVGGFRSFHVLVTTIKYKDLIEHLCILITTLLPIHLFQTIQMTGDI